MFTPIDSTNLALINALAQLTYLAFKIHAPNWLLSETDAK